MNLGPFLRDLEARLDRLTPAQIRQCILGCARDLPPRRRENFLAIFSETSAAPTRPAPPASEGPADPTLIEDIEGLVSALEDGKYYEGYGWDHELQTKRAFGDESWVWEMDGLFERCADAYMDGDREVAGEGYGRLLHAFEMDEEVGHFCGPDYPTEMVETDLTEAKARYLRSLYETLSADERPARLLEEMQALSYVGSSEVGLADVREAEVDDPPGLDRFLPAWIELLEEKVARAPEAIQYPGPDRRLRERLLREATQMSAGTAGLEELARKSGDHHPGAYYDWVAALVREGALRRAIEAAREGTESIREDSSRAILCDYLAHLAAETDDPELLCSARRMAWRADPAAERLIALWEAWEERGSDVDRLMSEELQEFRRNGEETSDRLAAMLELGAGDYEAATERALDALGWSNRHHPGPVVFPFLLLAVTGLTQAPPESRIETLVDALDYLRTRFLPPRYPFPDMDGIGVDHGYSDLLLSRLSRRSPDASKRDEYREAAASIARERMRAIVSNQHRKAYERAASVMVALAEVHALIGEAEEGVEVVRGAREEFPRHSAFRRELNALIASSPVLPDAEV